MKTFEFSNGDRIDAIGLGTWKSEPGEVGTAVKTALEVGYRHIDCAAIYGNEAEVGEALTESMKEQEIDREELFITSKLWNTEHKKEDVIPALKQTLSDLQLDYLDLYLIHWPVAYRPDIDNFPEDDDDYLPPEEAPIIETWEAMLEAKEQGLIKHVGVSNFSSKKLEDLISLTDHTPEMNQVELHPYLQQDKLLTYCKDHDILVTAYSPLGSGDRPERMKKDNEPTLLNNEVITTIAAKHDVTPAQVLIKWAVERDTIVIPKSTNDERIEENFNSKDLDLDREDMNRIRELDINYRYLDGEPIETDGDMYTNVFDE